ncbi:DUF937 domain-containing protein [Neorhizobium sp. JUb45]|uniref:DUF937 domain-containing protein n=1 Tax=unclassified Neorhizobium TaxID=2629175 RepID=UPI0010499524|nr:DUF937 domain-containing protein [Neorhizobium sp. JUb45]TCR04093.1 hypothetical protein EDF70_102191 [Neorhizobium sp. JUb45]
MLPLFEMMLKAQNGAVTEALAKQFGLAQEQAAEAIAALVPAFSSGLKRTTANPYDVGPLMAAMFSGAYGKYFEDVGKAFTDQGKADGNIVLERLFGSKDVSRAIAAQAEQFTGIGQDVFKRMMPAMAGAMMGGLFKQATGQLGDTDIYPMAAIGQHWMKMMGFGKAASKTAAHDNDTFPSAFDNPYAKTMRAMWGLEKAEQPQATAFNPFADNPFAKSFQEMMAGSFGAQPMGRPTAPSPSAETASTNPLMDAMNSMFDSGLDVHKSYQKNMEAIFDRYLGPMEKH